MKNNKIILIICGVIVVLAIVILIFYIAKGGSLKSDALLNSNNTSIETGNIELELSISPEGTTNGTVTIYASATVDGESDSVQSITLPNGQVVNSSSAQYEVSKNGDYDFIVLASNGSTTTESITISNIDSVSAYNPYLPAGFTHVSGTEVDTGYIIEDESGNQYVWVPVETGILTRNTDSDEKYEEIDSTATGFYNSVTKYYGFYIARYESSKNEVDGETVAASMYGVMPSANVTYADAYEAAVNAGTVYGYSDVNTALINSYAWDTTLNWINETVTNYSTNTSYGNYKGTILKTGTTETDQVNGICDLAGNLREWTTEVFYPTLTTTTDEEEKEDSEEETTVETYRVIRGGSANINKVAASHVGNPESLSDSFWGFRMILYKN